MQEAGGIMPDPSPNESRPGWFVAWVLAPLYEFWNRLRGWLLVLKPCRASLLLVAAALAFFLGAPQGEDVVRALAERQSGHQDEWQRFLFFMGVLAWTLSAWYWARGMMQFRFPGVPARDARLQGFRVWVPRLIGTAAPLGVAASLYLASRGYDLEEHGDANRLLRIYAVLCALGAAAFLVTVSLRRTIARFAYERVKGLAATLLAVPRSAEEVYGELEFRDLAGPTRLMLGFAVLVAIVLFCLFTFFVQWSAPLFGTAGILLFAAAGWIAAGSVLDFIGMRLRYPAFLTLLALTMLFSLWNDNHEVRTLAEPQAANREDVRAAFREWMKRQPERAASYPMVFVDAEGGGIRAAYWAATVLGRIQDDNPCFAERLFSLSGVSGGSLGASVFLALFVERRGATSADCRAGAPGRPSIMESAQQILGEDFLAPVSAALLYPDLAQRFIPVPVRALDRATALEQSWERAWREHTGTNRFAEPFDALWADRSRWTPALFLNATWVETGKRLIVSNLRVSAPPEEAVFVDGEDAQAFFAPRSLALSTAAHMSARFTYVSPAGTLQRDGVPRGRGVYARDTLAWHVGEDHFLKFGLCRSSGNIPLGWVLSASTQKLMDAQLTEKKCASRRDPGKVVFDNPRNLERIRELLK
jgi:hypothetical protein